MRLGVLIVVVGLIAALIGMRLPGDSIIVDDSSAYQRTESLGWLIKNERSRPVHILYVHGIYVMGPGFSRIFIKGLCRYSSVQCPANRGDIKPQSSVHFDIGPMPDATLLGQKIWKTEQDWDASRPFVNRYVFPRASAPPVILDEVNWWPLLFPLKCRSIVAPDAELSGADMRILDLCNENTQPYHRWITDEEYKTAKTGPSVSKGGAELNVMVKQGLVDWGLVDAVIALGPMRTYIHRTIDASFAFASGYDGQADLPQTFVVVAASLGSFIVMDAAMGRDHDAPHATNILSQTSDLYFFANQFALLELGRIRDAHTVDRVEGALNLLDGSAATPSPSKSDLFTIWGKSGSAAQTLIHPKQIIAFSDPSDILTFSLPKMQSITVVNIYTNNATKWWDLFSNPIKAHMGYSANPAVLKEIFSPRGPSQPQ